MNTNNHGIRFRMLERGSTVDEDGIVTDPDGTMWGDVVALRKRADRLEREAAERAEHDIFKPAQDDGLCDDPTPEGGTLDALAEGIWARRKRT